MKKITRNLKEEALTSGIDLIGITSARPFEITRKKRKNVNPMRRHCQNVIQKILKKEGYRCVSSIKIPAKLAAARSGLGKYGKNSVVITEKLGSWVMFECLITDAPLEILDCPVKIRACHNCNICIHGCPTQAIGKDYTIDISRCITNWLWGAYAPRELREKEGIRLFGCGECLKIFPANKHIKPRKNFPIDIKPRKNFPIELENFRDNPELIPLAIGDREYYKKTVSSFPRWAGMEAIRGNAIIALGNIGGPKAVSVLEETLLYPKPQIRAYPAWALGKIGGKKAKTILEKALSGERNSKVIEEIKLALNEIDN